MHKRLFIGTDIGGTHMRTALMDEGGTIIQERKVPTNISDGARLTCQRLIEECRIHMQQALAGGDRVTAIGLAVAGKLNPREGRVIFSPNLPQMRDYPLGAELRESLGIPVAMENDANAFGIGEKWVGSGRHIRNYVGVTLGTGVGGCLILDGRIWNGDELGFAGEVGHMIVHPDGPPCACGSHGCLEAHSSATALVQGVKRAIEAGKITHGPLYDRWRANTLDAVSVFQSAREGDVVARDLFDRFGWALGLALAGLFTVLGIRHAIIGGGVSAAWSQFIDPLRRSLAERSSMLDPEQAVILQSGLGDDAALLGAAWLARNFFEDVCEGLPNW